MNNELTELVLIVDRSGSMGFNRSIQADAQGGVNALIEDQKTGDGQCNITLVEFDNSIDTLCENKPAKDVSPYTLNPRGGTALLDAIGVTFNNVGRRLAETREDQRPGLVLVTIVTDGGENASREFKKGQIEQMIKTQKEVYNWQIDYLSSDLEAIKQAQTFGFDAESVTSLGGDKMFEAYNAVSAKTKRARTATMRGMAVNNSYTADEKASMK